METDRITSTLGTVDSIVRMLTGRGIADIALTGLTMFGPEIKNRPQASPDDPYVILGVRHDAPNFVIKAAFRALAQKHHPDHEGDANKFDRIQDAYNSVRKQRGF